MDDNLRCAAARATWPALAGAAAPGFPAFGAPGAPWRPGGSGVRRDAARGAPLGSGGAALAEAVPPASSPLRRAWALDALRALKPPYIYSPRFSSATSVAEAGLLRWQGEPLLSSLTMLASGEARKAAVRAFACVQGFCGDRPLARPLAAGAEVLSLGAARPDLRDELLLQLLKQGAGNPSATSAERAAVLLFAALSTFAPSEEAENAVELALREARATPCVWALHLTLLRGGPGAAGVPDAPELARLLERAGVPPLPTLASLDADAAAAAPARLADVGGDGLLPPPPRAAAARGPFSPGADAAVAAALASPPPYGAASGAPRSAYDAAAARAAFDAAEADDHAHQLAFLSSLAAAPAPPARAPPPPPPPSAAAAAYLGSFVGSAASAAALGTAQPPPPPSSAAAAAASSDAAAALDAKIEAITRRLAEVN
jgi:hypothetical protein